MPVWNGACHLREALESILHQTERNFEFLLIDDGSTDDTVAIIESYQDPQIQLSREIALKHCQQFMRLNRQEAERALGALRYMGSGSTLRDWFWLVFHCLPRLRVHSIELWIWAAQKTVLRVHHAIRR